MQDISLKLSTLGKFSADNIFEYFSYLSQKMAKNNGDNLHEMSHRIF